MKNIKEMNKNKVKAEQNIIINNAPDNIPWLSYCCNEERSSIFLFYSYRLTKKPPEVLVTHV